MASKKISIPSFLPVVSMVNLKCKLCGLILFANLCLYMAAAIFTEFSENGKRSKREGEREGRKKGRREEKWVLFLSFLIPGTEQKLNSLDFGVLYLYVKK
jgi:hypothetical protein